MGRFLGIAIEGSALPMLGLPSKADVFAAALEGLVQANDRIMNRVPLPPLYACGARYRNIKHNDWRTADRIATEGWADCEGLSGYRTAELRRGNAWGEYDPGARVGTYHTGRNKYHAIVIRGDDTIEDPSVLLGMKARRGMPRNRSELNFINAAWPNNGRGFCVVGDAGDEVEMTTTLVEKPNGETAAQVKIPLADGTAIVAQTPPAVDKALTAARGAALVADLAANVAKNPATLAMLNPYTAAAVTLYNNPDVQRSLRTLGGAAKSLGSSVRSLFHF